MKKRILSVFLLVVLTVTGAAALTGCEGSTYKITYHVDYATDAPTPTSYKLSRNDVDLWVPKVEAGYTFENWYSNADFDGVAIDYIPAGTKQDMEFYGRVYRTDGYNVSYKIMCEGEELDMTPPLGKIKYNFAKKDQFDPWIPELMDGYYFGGWFADEEMENEPVEFILQTDLGDKKLYGEYIKGTAPTPYTITFIVDGAVKESTQKTYTKSHSNRPLWIFTDFDSNKEGFDGWYENPDFSGNKVTFIPADTDGDKTYYGRMREPEGYGQKTNRKKATEFTLHSGRTEADAENGLWPELSLSDFYGKPVLLNFWSSKCDPCKREMPYLQAAYLEYGDRVEFLMINAMALKDTPEDAKKFIKDDYTFPWHHDNGAGAKTKATTAYKVTAFPTTVLIDRWGYVAKIESIEIKNYAMIESLIELILE